MAGFRGTSTYDLFQLYFQIQDNTEVARKCFEISHCRVSMLVQLQGLVEAIMFCTSGLAAIGGLEVAFVATVVHGSVVHRLPAAAWTILSLPDVSHLKVTSRHVVAVKGLLLGSRSLLSLWRCIAIGAIVIRVKAWTLVHWFLGRSRRLVLIRHHAVKQVIRSAKLFGRCLLGLGCNLLGKAPLKVTS